jgi:hypothetical protein
VYEDVQNVTQIAGILLSVLGKFKIVLNFLQISSSFVKLFSVAFPPVVLRYFAALSFINVSIADLFSFGCVFESTFYVNLVSASGPRIKPDTRMLVQLLLTGFKESLCSCLTRAFVQLISTLSPLLLGLVAFGVLTLYQYNLREDDAKRERKARQALAIFTTFMILVLYLTLPYIATSVFQTFNCRSFDDGTWLVRADYRWGSLHLPWRLRLTRVPRSPSLFTMSLDMGEAKDLL